MDNPSLDLYLVRNKEGKWFRAKGYAGSGDTWTDDVRKARVYGKIGPARAIVSFFSNHYPEYGTPDLVRFHATPAEVMDEEKRVKGQRDAKIRREQEQEARMAKYDLEQAQIAYQKAAQKLAAAKSKVQ